MALPTSHNLVYLTILHKLNCYDRFFPTLHMESSFCILHPNGQLKDMQENLLLLLHCFNKVYVFL